MPPKRNIKNNSVKPKSPALVKSTIGVDSQESTEAELKFDQEVLWSIAQFEKLINTGKLSEAKKQESIRAINTLKKPNVQKIQKIQLMRQYFKDIKTKMQKDEENQKNLSFQVDEESEHKKGVFLKKKSQTATDQTTNGFRFNFNDPSEDNLTDITSKVKSLEIKEI